MRSLKEEDLGLGGESAKARSTVIPSLEGSKRVLIAHPGRQHSHQSALALYEAHSLACYATGIPTSQQQFGVVGRRLLSKYSVYDDVDIPLGMVRLNMTSTIVNRLFGRYVPPSVIGPILYETYKMFDRWVAKLVERQRFDAVIAFENSALHTFEAAKRTGARCILDAAGLHRVEADHRVQSKLPKAYKRRVDHRKDREISLADCIFTTSDLAARSYLDNVRVEVPVKAIPLGADIDRFKPALGRPVVASEQTPFTFVFVGAASRLKGFDLLLDAVEELMDEGAFFRVVTAGVLDESLFEGRERVLKKIQRFGRIGHDELVSVLVNAHCLVLPSRFDSFGMVVPEAMACGLPVIVSDMVGAKQIVADGRNGFVVPAGDAKALAGRMRWLIDNRGSIGGMSLAARAAAEQTTWTKYRSRFAAAVQEVLLGG